LLGNTGGRIAALLAGGERTVAELGEALKLTPNAVRMQLTRLERDGVVEQAGQRGGFRKPHLLYRLSPQADGLFPKAYSLVLGHLLATIAGRHPEEAKHLLEEVGRRIAAAHPAPSDPQQRLAFAMNLLSELGAVAELQQDAQGRAIIQGQRCPLGEIVGDHPELCQALETLIAQLLGESVCECCDRSDPPHCRFIVGA
jgi:predicted ArsR family transcriptional regulator